MADNLPYPAVCLDDLPEGEEVHQMTCYWDLLPETVDVFEWEIYFELGQAVFTVSAMWKASA